MTTKEAITLFKYYLQSNHKQRTIDSYTLLLDRFNAVHAEKLLECQRSFQSEPFSVVKSEPPCPHDRLISSPSFPTFPRSL